MYIQFLGTNAGSPSIKRNVSSIALILNDNIYEIWLFDCGEATQHQILYTSIKLTKIRKIFITHMHGDHILGLLGLLTSRSINNCSNSLEIYGNKGIKKFINLSLKYTNSYINFPLEIFEIQEGELFNNGFYKVDCFLLNHSIECYGYKIKKCDKIGHLNVKKLISEKIYPSPIYKYLKLGQKIFFNNKWLDGKKYLGKNILGKSMIILGDTSPLKYENSLLYNLDLLIHESTLDDSMKNQANSRGHSTNIQAALLAKKYNVKKLIITHFSSRYSYKNILKMLKDCRKFFSKTYIAKDFSIFKI